MQHAVLALPLILAAAATAQCIPQADNFCVTVAAKTPAHPQQAGSSLAYYISGVEGPALTLTRGQTYTFTMVNVDPFHPFYITTVATGGGSGMWMQGVNPTMVSENQVMTFEVPAAAPATLWYGCHHHIGMGWRIDIIDPPSCYANCDASTTTPVLNVADFTCFLQKFAAGDAYANCDESTTSPILNVADFTCFLQKFAAGCR